MHFTHELRTFQENQSLYEDVVADLIGGWPVGGVFVDGGAHAGLHTEPMLRRGDVTQVYAVEAIPRLCTELARRFRAADKLTLVEAAVGKDISTVQFQVAVDMPGYSGLHQRAVPEVKQWESIEVQMRTLDQIVGEPDIGYVGLIKLDLEGGELDAIRGGLGILSRSRPLVVFENGLRASAAQYGYDWKDFSSTFSALNYEVRDFFGNRVDRAYWDAILRTYMFLAVPFEGVGLRWLDEHLPTIVARRAGSAGSAGA